MTETNPEKVTEEIGGVQGSDPAETDTKAPAEAPTDESSDVPVPDAAEIEWAGAVVKKAPRAG